MQAKERWVFKQSIIPANDRLHICILAMTHGMMILVFVAECLDKHPGGSETARAFLMFCFWGVVFALGFTVVLTLFK